MTSSAGRVKLMDSLNRDAGALFQLMTGLEPSKDAQEAHGSKAQTGPVLMESFRGMRDAMKAALEMKVAPYEMDSLLSAIRSDVGAAHPVEESEPELQHVRHGPSTGAPASPSDG
mgnify:FL=1